ncbi:MAG: hypothetical protein QOG83_1401 [Alphaproteobacteria bacterium]|nr:hypothetical protein [Alphaproteobacteria bacterium]
MMGRLDEIAKRLFAAFVTPLINVIIVSLILNLCLSDQYSIPKLFANLDFGGLTKYISELLIAIFSGNFDTVRDFLTRYSSQIAAASTIVAILLILAIILVMFLLDRAIYYVSWLSPREVEFDLKAYAARHCAGERLRRLYGLIGRAFDFATAYGVVTSFLGEYSADQGRLSRRGELVRAHHASRVGFDYAVSYCILLLAAWVFALFARGYFSFWPLTMVLVVALLVALGDLVWHAHASQALVEFDIDSFIRLRLYGKADDRFLPLPDAGADLCSKLAAKTGTGFLGALNLRHKPAGIIYETYAILRHLFAPLFRRKARPR